MDKKEIESYIKKLQELEKEILNVDFKLANEKFIFIIEDLL